MGHATLTYIYEDNIGSEKGLAVAANLTHAVDAFIVRELVRRCNYDNEYLIETANILAAHMRTGGTMTTNTEYLAVEHGFISLHGAEFINKDNVQYFTPQYRLELLTLIHETLSKPSFEVVTIHDEFKCHPRYMNHLRQTYVTILAELADSTVGQQIIREVRNDDTFVLTKLSTGLGDKIVQSEYFLS